MLVSPYSEVIYILDDEVMQSYSPTCTVCPTIKSVHPTWCGPFPRGIPKLFCPTEFPI